jgi:hypothetical protein
MMKRFVVVLLVLLTANGVFAGPPPTYQFSQFQSAFQDFANGAAGALPLEASVGLNWSDAYIGQFPHFGIGVTAGAATIPFAAVKSAINTFGGSIPSSVSFISNIGIPVPAYTLDARIGGFILPFDIGFKFGYLPAGELSSLGINGFSADYLMVGADIRYALLKDSGLSPGLSVGVGYTYMRGNVGVPGVLNGAIRIASVSFGGNTHYIDFSNPSLNFFWNTSVIDAKVQLSKTLFIITPYIGVGASYGISNAGGGMQSTMQIDGGAATQPQLDQINSAFGTNFTLQNPGFGVFAGGSGFSARAFGGFSFNIFILKIGVGAEYELLSGSMAAMANARIQL